MSKINLPLAGVLAVALAGIPCAAQAQPTGYGGVGGSTSRSSAASDDGGSASIEGSLRRGGRQGVQITPYIEAAQILQADLHPDNDLLTYSQIAAGVDATILGRNNAGAVSLRYERRFGWGSASDSDLLTGVARGFATITPGVKFEAGAIATRKSVENNGTSAISLPNDAGRSANIYSVYAGPSVSSHVGEVDVTGGYQIGYSQVESPDAFVTAPGLPPSDVFDHSISHNANIHAGVRPGEVLPVGIGAGATFYQEDASNLDQRIRDFNARIDFTYPVSQELALVAGVGYEDVEVSSRDAVRDALGVPVTGNDGRYVTDKSTPRILAYDAEGITWDAGVIWRPGRRTALEAHVGKRYGTTSYYGSFAYAPTARSTINVSVYDSIAGFGGRLKQALIALPTEFQAIRNPLSGDVTGCVDSQEGGSCLNNALSSVRSSAFRARGVMATYGHNFGRISAGFGGGYDRRRFIGAPGTVLASMNGVVEQNYWLNAYLNGKLGEQSLFTTQANINWFQSNDPAGVDGYAMQATAAYSRLLTNHLSASAALGVDGISRETLPDQWSASAMVGVRYTF